MVLNRDRDGLAMFVPETEDSTRLSHEGLTMATVLSSGVPLLSLSDADASASSILLPATTPPGTFDARRANRASTSLRFHGAYGSGASPYSSAASFRCMVDRTLAVTSRRGVSLYRAAFPVAATQPATLWRGTARTAPERLAPETKRGPRGWAPSLQRARSRRSSSGTHRSKSRSYQCLRLAVGEPVRRRQRT